ncbi:hypothetical protein DHX103_07425 [Planococcus sp. X10-3]|uniref:hypothetical protein n=1 Tax=Planococcus sp. X10-3 TaxID=3061240 RepID=UPI003BB0382C
MQDTVEKIVALLPSMNFENYWDGFGEEAFALYDESTVYLFNHPKCRDKSSIHFPKDDQFYACTYILFEDVPTAIVDIRYFDFFEDIYSLIAHESFHAHQYTLGESRFPNETIGPAYPSDAEHIHLRIQERKALHDAVFENSNNLQQQLINEFITLREKRTRLYAPCVNYENRIETIEGPAFYVEYQALRDISNSENALQRYASMLLDAEDSHVHIRKSCYSSGLFLCLLLDQLLPRWQAEFMHSERDLYHFFKKRHPDYSPVSIAAPDNKADVDGIIKTIEDQKKKAFQSFTEGSGHKMTLTGEMKAAGFDPMNIIILGDRALHQKFLKIRIGAMEHFLQGPVLTVFDKDFMTIKTVEIFTEKPPHQSEEALDIEGIGTIQGNIEFADETASKIALK